MNFSPFNSPLSCVKILKILFFTGIAKGKTARGENGHS